MEKVYYNQNLKKFRKKLRNNPTKSEVVLWKYLKNGQMGCKFRRQCSIGKYIVDFYCPEIKLVIEVDGITHNDETVYDKDVKKERFLTDLGLRVERYGADKIFHNTKDVTFAIFHLCEGLRTVNVSPS